MGAVTDLRTDDDIDVDVTVLGLGRMGRAMAERYDASDKRVATWSRSHPGTAATAVDAARRSGTIVLALFDDRACHDVLEGVGADVAGRLVVNTSTVSVAGAEVLAARVASAGGRYVHAPVLGSVPAVLTGTLRVLAGGSRCDVADAARALESVAAEVRHVGSPGDAAAAKLLANSSLASSVLALRDSLEAAAALGLPLPDALDVLELGRLGDVVRAVRTRLRAPEAEANFSVSAIAKDVGLLAEDGGPHGLADRIGALLDSGLVGPDDDFTALAVPVADRVATR